MKKRLMGGTMLIVVLALLISTAVGAWSLRERDMSSARQNLQELLNMVDAQNQDTDPERAVEVFKASAPDKRLTLIAADGTVLLDTESATTENHADRPEIRQAKLGGWGEATRPSDTMGVTMLYEAKVFTDGVIGRAAMPLSSLDSLLTSGLVALAVAFLAALVLSLILSRRMAQRLLDPLNTVGSALQGVLDGCTSPGELEKYQGDDELRPILRYIEKLIGRLREYIDDLTAERDKVGLILDCMDEGLILLDESGGILAINRAARELFGVPEGESGGIQIFIRSRRVREALDKSRGEKTSVVLDVSEETFGGRDLRMFLAPVNGRQFEGERVGTSILISDVTELKKAEGIRSEFTANVSHELKTPLTSIKGFTDMLSTGMVKDPEDQKRFLTMIGVEVDRLIELINDILKLSELESVAIEQCEETADPLAVADGVRTMLIPAAQEAGVTLVVEGAACQVALPESRLKELVLNLMENAVKYNVSGGRVDVKVAPGPSEVTLTVADTGIGIPEEGVGRVFERFYRVDKGRARKNGGTGLGLAIVKHIVQLYGGTVKVASTLGRGTTFTVTLPLGGAEQ